MNPFLLTRDQVRQVDSRAVEHYGMSGLVLMENAGRGCVDVLELLDVTGQIVICCGKGNNAGDGFVIARHLDLRGHDVKVLMCDDPAVLHGDAAVNYQILTQSDVPIVRLVVAKITTELEQQLEDAAWIVDAIVGTGAHGKPRSPWDVVIRYLNAHKAQRLAVDVPSGLDCDTGIAADPTFQADCTCTFVAAKPGLVKAWAQPYVGKLCVLDIGVPQKLLDEFKGDG